MEGHHEAIIPPQQFDFVQAEIARRDKNGKYSGVSIFSNKVKCGCCGSWYGAKVWHSRDKYRKVIYRCNKKYQKGIKPCTTPFFTEDQLKEIFLKALNTLIASKDATIANNQELIDTACQTEALIIEKDGIEQELNMMVDHLNNLILRMHGLHKTKKSIPEKKNRFEAFMKKSVPGMTNWRPSSNRRMN